MSDISVKDQAPTQDDLEREARRLARTRHLTIVGDEETAPPPALLSAFRDPDPDPKAAA